MTSRPGYVKRDYDVEQKHLSVLTHAAMRKLREMPIQAVKRVKKLEDKYGGRLIYEPEKWSQLESLVEKSITNWGAGRDRDHRTDTL